MALRVWLPMTKDLRNQGLSEIVKMSNTDFTLKSGGKLGSQCQDLSKLVRLYCADLVGLKTFSYAFWYKPETSSSTLNWNDVIAFYDSSGSKFRLETSYSNNYILSMHNNSGYGIVQNKSSSYGSNVLISSATYSRNTWYHVAVTVEENKDVRAYINGELKYVVDRADGSITGYFNLGESDGNDKEEGSMNDLRIYDHALSLLEVKELSKGLVLHYRLSGVGRPNNIKRSAIVQKSSTMTYDSGEYTFICPYLDSPWGAGFYVNDTSIKWKSGQTWLISMDVYTPQSISWNADINNKPDVEDQSSYTGNDYDITSERKSCTNGSLTSKTLKAGWNKIWYTQKAPTTYGLYNWSTNFGIVTTGLGSGNSITVKIKNVKGEIIEDGDVLTPTPWTPNSSDPEYHAMGLDDGIEYDTSGFQHNGTKTGTITWDSDSARYNSCYAMTGTTYINCGKPYEAIPDGSEEFTVNMWAYKDTWDTSTQIYSCTESGGFSLSTGNNSISCYCHVYRDSSILTNSSGATITNSSGDPILLSSSTSYISFTQSHTLSAGWHMFTMVYTKEGLKLYVDGSLARNSESSSIGLHYNLNCNLFIGAEATGAGGCSSPYLNGKASDFRIFAKALDADAILALYRLGGSIDSNGVFHTYEYVES